MSTQVLENLTGIALGNGFALPNGKTRSEWVASKLLVPKPKQDRYLTSFFESLLETQRIRDCFIQQLKKTLNPRQYGIEREWKLTQSEALEAIIRSFENWSTRPLLEVPTGVGKSMLEGAIVRAYYDTLCIFGLEDKFEIIIFTSRIHIGDQMIGKISSDATEDDDEPLEYGDVMMWLPFLKGDEVRLLAGRTSRAKEGNKNAKLTIACYQGLNERTVSQLYKKKAGLVVLDESHRVTDRVRIMLENKMHSAFFVGGSATTKGAKHNNPFLFFEAQKPERNKDGSEVLYNERLAYYASIALCVERKELKRIRYVNASTHFNLSSVASLRNKELPNKEAAKFIAKNVPTMKHILQELFLGDQTVLDIVGSKKVIERQWLVFVDRVSIAEELAEFCNVTLLPLIRKKYGKKIPFNASYVSGYSAGIGKEKRMNHAEFNKRMELYQRGKITIMFSSEKLGEGSNVPNISAILGLRAYSQSSLWKALQEIGRGTRFVLGEDLLVVDGVFRSNKHKLAALTSVFGLTSYLSGGLVAGYQGEREAETKVFTLLKQGLSWKQVWAKLTKAERLLVPFVGKLISEPDVVGPSNVNLHKPVSVKSIEFIERQGFLDKKLYLTWQEASAACIELGISNFPDYKKNHKKDSKLPANLSEFYNDMPTSNVFFQKYYLTWREASEAAISLGIKNSTEYRTKYLLDSKLPSNPNAFYPNFPGYPTFLKFKKPNVRKAEAKKSKTEKPKYYSKWQQASKAAKKLEIKSQRKYKLLYKKDTMLPVSPETYYENFPGYGKFLGTNRLGNQKKYMTWAQAKRAMKKHGLLGLEGKVYRRKYKKDPMLPCDLHKKYPNFPGFPNLQNKEKKYSTWQQASRASIILGIKLEKEYNLKYKKDERLPSSPYTYYKNFPGWKKFLGKN